VNTIHIVGNLGRDPELSYTSAGRAVCHFSLASNRQYKRDDAYEEETTWFRVTAWGRQGELCKQMLQKGSLVYVKGRMDPDPETGSPKVWESSVVGEWRANFTVRAEDIRFLANLRPRED